LQFHESNERLYLMCRIILITGGARSGKSTFALNLAENYVSRAFLATAEVTDPEMELRIRKHREERGQRYTTIEEPLNIAGAISGLPDATEVVVVDCLTVWLGNLMHHLGQENYPYTEIESLLSLLTQPSRDMILVSNELGMGIVPEYEMGRWFRDAAGRLNQEVARRADEVVFMVSGCPMWAKRQNA
jgi:adenosylcobinamide kinase / adenosylcobinamide-phosphate guanylyltransferase